MYYRRKILLALLEQNGGVLGRLKLQKLLFLLCTQQPKAAFDFVPYKFGSYSFRATADARTMVKYGLLATSAEKQWTKVTPESFYPQLKKADRQLLDWVMNQFSDMTNRELIEYTYRKYPYYAINSSIAGRYLSDEELAAIDLAKPADKQGPQLFTIGYEGISAEAYFNKLLQNGVRALVDVRRNAASMKYGFHKSQLAHVCESLNLTYYHMPEVGIANQHRKSLSCQADYDALFAIYREEMLTTTATAQLQIAGLLEKHERIALTCFEAQAGQCHRSHLADYLANRFEKVPSPLHL